MVWYRFLCYRREHEWDSLEACLLVAPEGIVGIDGGEIEMAEVTWNPKKEERETMFLYHFFEDDIGERVPRRRGYSIPGIEDAANKLNSFTSKLARYRWGEELLFEKLIKIKSKTHGRDFEDPHEVKRMMLDIFYHHCISLESFNWIAPDNERLCNFIWASLLSSYSCQHGLKCYQTLDITDNEDDMDNRTREPEVDILNLNKSVYHQLNLPIHVSKTHDKIKYIIRFFDLWDESVGIKERQMKKFEDAWLKIKNKSKMEDWLNKNEAIVSWAWDYTQKKYLKFKTPDWVDVSKTNDEQIKATLITLYDLLPLEHRKIWMASLKNNGTQQKYRKKISNRKVMNAPLSEEHHEKLKKMAKDSNRRIYQIVEDMIEKEYQHRYPELFK